MKLRILKFYEYEKLFFPLYIAFLIVSILSSSFYAVYIPGMVFEYVPLICVITLVVGEFSRKKNSRKEILGLIFTLIAVVLISRVSADTRQASVFYMLFFMFAAREIDFKKIAKVSALVIGVTLLLVVLSSQVGIIQDYIDTELRAGTTRHYLGFTYTLYGPALLLNYTMLKCYVWNKKHRVFKISCLYAASMVMYTMTQARLSFLCCIVVIAVFCFQEKLCGKKHWAFLLLIPIYFVCFLLALFFTISYSTGSNWIVDLNAFLGNRLANMQKSLMLYGVSLFGENIKWIGAGLNIFGKRDLTNYLYVDCFYIQILQHYGIIFTLFFLIVSTVVMYKCYKLGLYNMLLFFALVALHGLIDDLMLYVEYNTFWMAVIPILLSTRYERDYSKERENHGFLTRKQGV